MSSTPPAPPPSSLDLPRQTAFFLRSTSILPQPYTSGDANMLSLAFFILAGLDLLGLLEEQEGSHPPAAAAADSAIESKQISPAQKQGWIQWIYSFQAPDPAGGFTGSRFWDLGDHGRLLWEQGWGRASLANTFMGLLMLLMLGDDLGALRKAALADWVRGLQSQSGGFAEEVPAGIACILGPRYECVDVARLRAFVVNAQEYEGGVGQSWAMEGHSGLNYCAIGCLTLLDRLDQAGKKLPSRGVASDHQRRMRRLGEHGFDVPECVDPKRQHHDGTSPHEYFGLPPFLPREEALSLVAGFSGRTNKMADTCYGFWNLSALDILGMSDLANHPALRRYLLDKTQHRIGGFSKAPGEFPDLMHSYLGLAALAVMREEGLKPLDPALCVSRGVWTRIERFHGAVANAEERRR
ncbi:hypothetical protein DV735_g880, partial [Chaetothyriales sp. CBS 134920]